MWNVRLDEAKAGIKFSRRNISNLTYVDDTTLMAKTWTDAEAETPILWQPDAKNWLIGRYPDSGKDLKQKKGMTEDEMVEWHHRLNGHEFE